MTSVGAPAGHCAASDFAASARPFAVDPVVCVLVAAMGARRQTPRRQYQRGSPRPKCLLDILNDLAVPGIVADHCGVKLVDGGIASPGGLECGAAGEELVLERRQIGGPLRTHAESDRSALHVDDGLVPVSTHGCCGQSNDVLGLGALENLLKAERGELVALVHDDLSILSHKILRWAAPDGRLWAGFNWRQRAPALLVALSSCLDRF